jgi:hypothetical protein
MGDRRGDRERRNEEVGMVAMPTEGLSELKERLVVGMIERKGVGVEDPRDFLAQAQEKDPVLALFRLLVSLPLALQESGL